MRKHGESCQALHMVRILPGGRNSPRLRVCAAERYRPMEGEMQQNPELPVREPAVTVDLGEASHR